MLIPALIILAMLIASIVAWVWTGGPHTCWYAPTTMDTPPEENDP